MAVRAEIKQYVAALVEEFAPRQVVLFGSHARGQAASDSDVDLLVVMDRVADGARQAVEMRCRIPRAFPLDLVVLSRREMSRRVARRESFALSLLKDGQTLYEKRSQGVDGEGRG